MIVLLRLSGFVDSSDHRLEPATYGEVTDDECFDDIGDLLGDVEELFDKLNEAVTSATF